MTKKNTVWVRKVFRVISLSSGLLTACQQLFNSYISPMIVLVPTCRAREQALRIFIESLPSSKRNLPNRRKTINKATKTVELVSMRTLMCRTPVILVLALWSTFQTEEELEKAFWWCLTVACVNSFFNPYIYVYINLTLMNLMKFIKMIRDCSLGRLLPISIGQRRINPRLNYLGLIRTRNACQPLQEVWN